MSPVTPEQDTFLEKMQTNNQTVTTKQNPMQNGNVNTRNVCIWYQCVTKAEVKHQHHNKQSGG